MVDSQTSRALLMQERERWLRSVQVEGREELLFEFEMLLRGVERYFNLHNLPIDVDQRPVVTRDFSDELRDVREAIHQAIQIARQLLDPESDQKMVFRRYIESRLADDRARRALLEEAIDQDSPQESLFVLRQAFESLRSILDHLLKLEVVTFNVYSDVGNLALREIVLNRFFKPFRPLEFRIEYDRIKSVPILELLRGLPENERPRATIAFLGLFRLLHYLSYVDVPDEGEDDLTAAEADAAERRSRIILALVRSETTSLATFLENELAAKTEVKRLQAAAIKSSRELSRQSAAIVKEVLSELDRDREACMKAAIALTASVRKQTVLLARTIARAPESAMSFESLVNPAILAERLRTDLWIFAELCREVDKALTAENADADASLQRLRSFVGFFQDVSYQLLRYADYEPFDRFVAILAEFDRAPAGAATRARFAEDCRLFGHVVETTWHQVNRRAVLAGRRFDRAAAKELLKGFR